MTFWIYENWQAGPHKAVIHHGDCGFCNDGGGQSNGDYDPTHGTWHGPYNDVGAAKEAWRRLDVVVRKECGVCMKRKN